MPTIRAGALAATAFLLLGSLQSSVQSGARERATPLVVCRPTRSFITVPLDLPLRPIRSTTRNS
jgi:hypothetical protein